MGGERHSKDKKVGLTLKLKERQQLDAGMGGGGGGGGGGRYGKLSSSYNPRDHILAKLPQRT